MMVLQSLGKLQKRNFFKMGTSCVLALRVQSLGTSEFIYTIPLSTTGLVCIKPFSPFIKIGSV